MTKVLSQPHEQAALSSYLYMGQVDTNWFEILYECVNATGVNIHMMCVATSRTNSEI